LIYLSITSQLTLVIRQPTNDLPCEVIGTVYWTEGVGYQYNIETTDGTTKVLDIKFINDEWYLLQETTHGYRTDTLGKIPKDQTEVGNWPDDHPNNPKNLVLATAPSFSVTVGMGGTLEGYLLPFVFVRQSQGPSL
jgi:hypothetical protein